MRVRGEERREGEGMRQRESQREGSHVTPESWTSASLKSSCRDRPKRQDTPKQMPSSSCLSSSLLARPSSPAPRRHLSHGDGCHCQASLLGSAGAGAALPRRRPPSLTCHVLLLITGLLITSLLITSLLITSLLITSLLITSLLIIQRLSSRGESGADGRQSQARRLQSTGAAAAPSRRRAGAVCW
jgi:hypothetical protein